MTYPNRPSRRMPQLKAIAAHHQLGERPHCVRCGHQHPDVTTWANANGILERAHIIDRCCDGLDHAGNLAPLCRTCHKKQPMFESGMEAEALTWFRLRGADGRPMSPLLQAGWNSLNPPPFCDETIDAFVNIKTGGHIESRRELEMLGYSIDELWKTSSRRSA